MRWNEVKMEELRFDPMTMIGCSGDRRGCRTFRFGRVYLCRGTVSEIFF